MKIYLIQHIYDRSGEFGDAEPTQQTLGYFLDRAQADEYVVKYGTKQYVYAKPYDYLTYGCLIVQEMNLNSLSLDVNPFKGSSFEEQRAKYLATKKEDDLDVLWEDDEDWD